MDDNKTIYHTDDGTNVGLFKTVLDNPADKSSGNEIGKNVPLLL
jgi:hypothetical protein